MGQMVLGVVGGIIGGIAGAYGTFGLGTFQGASLGFAIGSGIGAVAFPPKIDGPSVSATLMQRSNYGATLGIGLGSFRAAGNVMWEGGLFSQTSGGGKGTPTVSTTTWYATFAVAICDTSLTGPIAGIRKIWMNGQIVYDVSSTADAATVAASEAWAAQYMVVYNGSASQAPDPTMEAYLGVGNVPGYHYTAYVMLVGLPLTPFSNVIPVCNFEVVNTGVTAGTVLLMHFEGADGSTSFIDSGPLGVAFTVDQGTPTISTAQQKFGVSSYKGNILPSYPGSPFGIIGSDPHLDIWQNDFTVEVFDDFVNNFSASVIATFGTSLPGGGAAFGNPSVDFILSATGVPTVYFRDSGGTNYAGGFNSSALTPNAWHHLAFVRHANVLSCYLDGVADPTTYTIPTTGGAAGVVGLIYANVGGSRSPNAGFKGTQGYMDDLRVSVGAVYTSNFTPPTAPLGVISGLNPPPVLTKIFETAITTPPFSDQTNYTNAGALWPIITSVSSSGISIVDRCNYATTFGQLMGDGNSYNYSFTNGSYLSTAGESGVQAAWGPKSQTGHGPTVTGAGFTVGGSKGAALATSEGNSVIMGYALNAATGSGFSSGDPDFYACVIVVSGYSTGTATFLHDCLPVLNGVANVPANFYIRAIYPCSDGAHIVVITASASNSAPYVWSIIKVTGGAPSLVSSGPMPLLYSPNAAPGNSDSGDSSPGNSTQLKGCLDVDVQTLWQQQGAAANGFNVLQLLPNQSPVLLFSQPSAFNNPGIFGPGSMFVYNGACAFTRSNQLALWQIVTPGMTLGTVCSTLSKAVGIPSSNIDVSSIASVPVRGVWIERQDTFRNILNSLAPTFWFGGVESDQKLAFRQRSAAPVATITAQDMGATESAPAGQSPLLITRVDDLGLPYHVDVGYYNIGADYQVGSQYAERLTTQSTQRSSVNAAAVMTDQDAVNAAAVILWDAHAGRLQFEFSTGLKWGQVEPTDIVTLQNDAVTNAGVTVSQSYLARITEKSEQGPLIKFKAIGAAPVYNQNVSPGIIVPAPQTVGSAGPTTLLLLDLPPLRDQDGNDGVLRVYVAMRGADTNWAGGILFKSLDGGATWIQQVTSTLASGIGVTTTALTDWTGGNFFDEASTVTVTIQTPGGSLASASELAVLNGANLCLIGNELLQFKNATLVSGSTYKLTGLLRGRIDTEPFMTGHNSGENFVLLSFANGAEANLNIEVEGTADIGVSRDYKAVTLNQPVASGAAQFLTSKGENLVCFYPCYLLAVPSPGSSDILLSWVRRNRITWYWLESVDVPMSEATEAYVVSIFNGPTVVRTISVSGLGVTTATYTSAQQTADFGSPQTTLTWGVQQISAITGAGNMTKITSTNV